MLNPTPRSPDDHGAHELVDIRETAKAVMQCSGTVQGTSQLGTLPKPVIRARVLPCKCGCGRTPSAQRWTRKFFSDACRKRFSRNGSAASLQRPQEGQEQEQGRRTPRHYHSDDVPVTDTEVHCSGCLKMIDGLAGPFLYGATVANASKKASARARTGLYGTGWIAAVA